ncbi:O-antigen ligase [Bosea sp. (in: a-proteobacteria)]|uniref:O-antigen ligase family protein n=1 Tax=Bosea sp. (in: a-proteobacteria) TaxID=1871050 RepID=UPI002603A1C7|nr:O-antigen ligase family protein [Bosea sp. (in: a-proteobacteria)]MCO5091035.1 O-antigen ligase family protein [Bosea sp. (in: a-proteobacteria)]
MNRVDSAQGAGGMPLIMRMRKPGIGDGAPSMPQARRRRSGRSPWVDRAARILVIVCVLNLNGVFDMMFDIGQAVSLIILATSLVLIATTGRRAWSPPFSLLIAAIASYLILGWLLYDPAASVEPASKYLQSYFNSILIIWALAGYVASLPQGRRLDGFLKFLRNSFLVAAASVWMSPLLYQYYVNLPFSAQQRMGGVFANPNEAAAASCFAVALVLALPLRFRVLQFAAVAMAAGAVIMTFSKGGISMLVILLGWHVVRHARGVGLVAIVLTSLLALVLVQNPRALVETVTDLPLLELDASQKDRILAVADIFGGEIDERTTTGRTVLWDFVIERALHDFPLGSGLGSAHHIVGGILELDVWQGAHNTFLMVWGESGVIPLLLLVSAMVAVVFASLHHAHRSLGVTCLFVLLVVMMSGHIALATRYHNVMLAVVLGLSANGIHRMRRGSHPGMQNAQPQQRYGYTT